MVTGGRAPAHEQFLDGIGGQPRAGLHALSELEYVDRVIGLANWSGNDLRAFYDLEAALLLGMKDARGHKADALRAARSDASDAETLVEVRRARALRDGLRERLARATADIARERRRMGSSPSHWAHLAHQVRLYPERALVNGALEIRFITMVRDLPAALDYGLLLLLAANRPFGGALRQCALAECGRFFLYEKPTTGRARTRYCSEEHRLKYHAQDAKNRVRRMREKRARRRRR